MLNERNTLLEDDGIEEEILVEEECSVAQAVWGDIQGNIENQTDLQNALDAKQDSLTEAQLNAVNSGITAEKVTTYDGYADQIASKANQSALNAEATTREQADTALGTRIDNEALARQNADNGLQTQIDAITSKSDVVDVVANYAALQAYDTSTLGNNDVVKVLDDETHEDALTYYRWSTTTQTWTYIGQEAPYYSKGQMDVKLAEKQDKLTAGANIQIQNGTISATDTKYTNGNGLNLNGTEFSANTTVLATKTDLEGYYTKSETDNSLAPKLEAEVVSTLPTTGEEGKLYLTPKAHTTQTAAGNPITATVAEQAGKLESFQLDGDTFQQTYTGQNLYNVATLQTGPYVTKDDDGWITITRDNSSGSSSSYTDAWTSNLALDTNTQYAIFLEIKAVSGTGDFDITSTNSTQGQFSSWQSKQIASLAAGQLYKVAATTKSSFSGITGGLRTLLNLSAGQSASITFRLSVLADTSVTTSSFVYEPYTGGTASPNPDCPQPIQTVTGEQTVSIIGKNLFNKNAVTNGGYIDTNGEVVAWETFGYSEYIRVIGGQTYSFSGTANNVGYFAKAAWYDSNKNFISYFSFGTSGQVTAPATAKFLRTSVRIASPSGLDTYQLELGSTITTYEAYKATNYPISLGSIELCKLGTCQDYIWKDGEDWKVHKATAIASASNRAWEWADRSPNGWYFSHTYYGYYDINKINVISKSFIGVKRSVAPNTSGAFITMAGDGSIGIRNPNITGSSNVTQFTNWLNSLNTTWLYARTTPTDTAITDQTLIAQLEAVRTASLETGTNTISNTATDTNLAGDLELGYYEYDPQNRYDKWLWLDINNEYEQIGS